MTHRVALHAKIGGPVCGFQPGSTTDVERPTTICGEPAAYAFTLLTWLPNAVGTSCVEHAPIVRSWPQLERIWSL